MKFLFTFWPKAEYQGIALTRMGANDRLVSFYYAHEVSRDFLERYLADGFVLSEETEALAAILRPCSGGKDAP